MDEAIRLRFAKERVLRRQAASLIESLNLKIEHRPNAKQWRTTCTLPPGDPVLDAVVEAFSELTDYDIRLEKQDDYYTHVIVEDRTI